MKKINLVLLSLLLVLSFSFVGFGVYAAAKNAQSSADGRIVFKSYDAKVTVECTADVGGVSGTEVTLDSTHDSGTWSVSGLSFITNNTGVDPNFNTDRVVTLSFVITNNSSRKAYAYFTSHNLSAVKTTDTLSGTYNANVVSVSLTGVTTLNPTSANALDGHIQTLTIVFTIPKETVNAGFTKQDSVTFDYDLVITSVNPA